MQAMIYTVRDLWPLLLTLVAGAGWLIWMRNRIRDHHKVLYSDKGQLQLVTVPMCAEMRDHCRNGVCGKVDEIKDALKETDRRLNDRLDKLDEALEKRVRRLHEKREEQDRGHAQDLQRINYFMGAVAAKLKIPPDGKKGPL